MVDILLENLRNKMDKDLTYDDLGGDIEEEMALS